PIPSVRYLNESLELDATAGFLRWKRRPVSHFVSAHSCAVWNGRYAGKQAFCRLSRYGRLVGCLDNVTYLAHRIIYKMMTGLEPEEIDHLNGNPLDNSISNLSASKRSMNAKNQKLRANNKSGFMGIDFREKRRSWRVRIGDNGKTRTVGHFRTIEEAVAARLKAQKELGYSNRHGT
ncbi:MAG: HNH endonuclease, partial [Rhizorhabdus sp.]